MDERAALLKKLEHAATDIVYAFQGLGVAALFVEKDGDTTRVVAPLGEEAQTAELLYQAADKIAEHARPHDIRLDYK